VARIKLRILGLPQTPETSQESTINAENIQDIVKHVEQKYPPDYYSFTIFLNGINTDNKSKNLRDGDEVVIVPAMSGG